MGALVGLVFGWGIVAHSAGCARGPLMRWLLLLLVGCSGPGVTCLDRRIDMEPVFEEWRLEPTRPVVVYVSDRRSGECPPLPGHQVVGCTTMGETIELTVSEFCLAKLDCKRVLLHEYGHALGLEHTPGGIMDAEYHKLPAHVDLDSWLLAKKMGNVAH